MRVEAFNYYSRVLTSMLDEVDYADTFQRLELLEVEIRTQGPSPGRLVARANLELAIGNYELAMNSARELQAMAESPVAEKEADLIIKRCTHQIQVEASRND